jgi:hypothetical protein
MQGEVYCGGNSVSDPFSDIEPYSYRASELGACIKRLAAARMGKTPHESVPTHIQAAFDRGNAHEIACLATMRSEGWTVTYEQFEVNTPLRVGTEVINISGHLDSMVQLPELKGEYVGEIKSPNAWRQFVDQMWSDNPCPLVQRYKWQISFYMLAMKSEALMICLDEDFKLRYHGIEEPFYSWDDVVNRINDVEEIVASGTLPKLCSVRDYPCPYFYLHEDETMEYTVDTVIDELVERRAKAKTAMDKLKKEVDYCTNLIAESMRGRKEVVTETSKVVLYDRTNTKYDYNKMKQDGIPIDDYKTVTVSTDIPRIGYRGEGSKDG